MNPIAWGPAPAWLPSARRMFAAIAIGAFCAAAGAQEGKAPAQAASPAQGEQPTLTQGELAQVEEAFWLCDYVSTNVGIRATPIGACLLVTEALKDVKFSGDFDAFVSWWRENKSEAHGKLELKYAMEEEKVRSGMTA